jgi:hypothetical protein
MGSTAKSFGLLLIVLFIASLVTFQSATVKADSPKTIIVPDDYSDIQTAINQASNGDTVLVKEGTYFVDTIGIDNFVNTIVIDKSIKLIGQNCSNTIINGQRSPHYQFKSWNYPSALNIVASNVVISGFTITNCYNAITFGYNNKLNSVNISGNILTDNWWGIEFDDNLIADNFLISNNTITDSMLGVSGSNCKISNNNFLNYSLVGIQGSQNLIVNNNRFSNSSGLTLSQTFNTKIYQNIFSNGFGCLNFSVKVSNTFVYNNIFANNTSVLNLQNWLLIYNGKVIPQSSGNLVYNNNFINNKKNVNVEHQAPYSEEAYRQLENRYKNSSLPINGTVIVSWDNGQVGNYWSDYDGNGSYVIDENNVDHYPLIQQVDISSIAPTPIEPLFAPLTIGIITISIIAVLISVVLFRRHRKTANLKQ